MKNLTLLLSLIMILFAFKSNAQSKFYVSGEANFIHEAYEVIDEGSAVSAPNYRKFNIPGTTILLGYELNPIISLEAGIATRPTKQGYKLVYSDKTGRQSQVGNIFYHIPIRTRVRIPLIGDRLFGTASLGVQLSVSDPSRVGQTDVSGMSEGSITRDGVLISTTRAQYITYHKTFLTTSAEVGFDFRINSKFNIYSTISYNRGFNDLKKTNIEYQFENEPVRQASVLHRGTYSSFNFGIRYNFGSNK